jgi:hypothetical protein
MKEPKIKLTAMHLELARHYQDIRARNPVAAAALINANPRAVWRGLEALRTGEQVEPDASTNPPDTAA